MTNQTTLTHQGIRHAILASALVFTTSAATRWTGSVDADFNNAANWDTAAVPAPGEEIEILTGNVVRNGNLDRAAESKLAGDASLGISNGRFLNGSGGSGMFRIEGGSLAQTGNYFIVSLNQPGSVVQTGGIVNSTVDRGWFMSDGGGSSGTYEISGGELNVSISGSLTANNNYAVHVGRQSGDDALLVNGGNVTFTATAANTRTYVSKGSRIEVNSGNLAFNDFRFVSVGRDGDATTTSKMLINGGTVTAAGLPGDGAVVIGNGNTGLISVNGGSLHLPTGPLWVGDGGAGGTYHQTSGSLTLDNGQVVVGRNGWGTFTLDGGTVTARNLQLDRDVATVNLNGGELVVDEIRGSTANRGTVNFNGTEIILNPLSPGGILISNLSHAYIGKNGLKIAVGELQSASIGSELARSPSVGAEKDGGLLKTGPGTLYVDRATSYSGPTRIEEGMVSFIAPSLPDRGEVSIATGGILDLFHYDTDTVRKVTIGTQTLATGVWGAPDSGAQFTHPALSGTGLLNVTNAAAESPFESWVLSSGLSGAASGAEADGDSDGVANLIEFATGGSAALSASRGIHQLLPQPEGAVFTIAARNDASFINEGGRQVAEIDGIRYEVEGSTDLWSWDATVEEIPAVSTGVPVPDAGWKLHSFRITGSDPARSFLRLVVTELP